jgi:FtsP/CotA-like multicopper oxidase with cupredoxin domain
MTHGGPRLALWSALLVLLAGPLPSFAAEGRVRTYFIAAEEIVWNYAPAGNVLADMQCCADAFTWLARGPQELPPSFHKAVFREYTDATFTTLKPRPPEWAHLGLLGPLIRAEVGDRIEVTLKNTLPFSVSLHPHGLAYDKASEGAGYPDGTLGADKLDDYVAPRSTCIYHWSVPERAGPGPADPSSVVWLYHSHVDAPRDTNTGLVGVILVTRRGAARPDGSPRDVDREFVTLYDIFDESRSRLAGKNTRVLVYPNTPGSEGIANLSGGDADDIDGANDANLFHTINGYIYGNLPMLRMKVGERVRWYLVALGGEQDLHTPHWHGNTVLEEGRRTDVVELLPTSMKVADMRPDNPGVWMYHCHVNDHIRAGMAARYEVVAP